MENGREKVCRRCGTLNDERQMMCVRCGEMLEVTEEKKYSLLKERMMSEKLLVFLFIILFAAYSYGIIFYAFPWIHEKLLLLGDTFIFEFYNNPKLTYIVTETIYTLCLYCSNFIAIFLIIETVINTKLIKRRKVNGTCTFIFFIILLCFGLMIIYKYKFDYVIIIEYLVSIIFLFPYIKKKIYKKSA